MQTTNNPKHHRLIILGSGPAGCTAALYAARANLKPIMIAGPIPGGQLLTATTVDNWPGDANGINGPELMEKMLKHAQKFDAEIIYDQIIKIDFTKRPLELHGNNVIYSCDALIVATGASARYLGLPSEQQFMGRGVSACATCDGYFYKNAKVALVGGGNTALEEALYLADIASELTIVHRRDRFRAEQILIDQIMAKSKENKINIIWNSIVAEILGDSTGVTGIKIKNLLTNESSQLDLKGVFIAIGHEPNTKIFQDINQFLLKENNCIKVLPHDQNNPYSTATIIPGVFAAGDVADSIYRQAITSAGTGCMAALDAKKYLDQL